MVSKVNPVVVLWSCDFWWSSLIAGYCSEMQIATSDQVALNLW